MVNNNTNTSGLYTADVITFDGTPSERGKCRKIQGEFYEENSQCFKMSDGKWHRINNGKVIYLWDIKRWVLKGDYDYIEVVVDIDDSGEPVIKPCTINNLSDISVYNIETGQNIRLLDSNLLKKLKSLGFLMEELSTGIFFFKSKAFSKEEKFALEQKRIRKYPTRRLDYRASYYLDKAISAYNKHIIYENIPYNKFAEELGNTTFGSEFETWNGTVAERHLDKLGIIPLKDGSLRKSDGTMAYEYTTVPLQGATGVYTLNKAAKCLNKYTEISTNCSTHIHIGNYELSKGFIVALYILAGLIEEEIFSLFPAYYKNTANFKGKSYCGPITKLKLLKTNSIDKNFEIIFDYLSGKSDDYTSRDYKFEGFNNDEHPMDNSGNHKWNINYRYRYINFISLIWGKAHTTEFRVHPPTLNPTRIINWLFITNAIVQFAYSCRNDPNMLLKYTDINLTAILKNVYDVDLSNYLSAYIIELKKNRERYDSVGDYTGIMWIKEDPDYSFKYMGMDGLV